MMRLRILLLGLLLLLPLSACFPGPEWLTEKANLKLLLSGLEQGDAFSFQIGALARSFVQEQSAELVTFNVEAPAGNVVLDAVVRAQERRCLHMNLELENDKETTLALDVRLFALCGREDAGILTDSGTEEDGGIHGEDGGAEEDAGVHGEDGGAEEDAGGHGEDGGAEEDAGSAGEPDDDAGRLENDAGEANEEFADGGMNVVDAGETDSGGFLDAGFFEGQDAGVVDAGFGGEHDGGVFNGDAGGLQDAGNEQQWGVESLRLRSVYGACSFDNCNTFVEVELGMLTAKGFDGVERNAILSAADFAFVASSAGGTQANFLFEEGCDHEMGIPQTFLRRERRRGQDEQSYEVETTGCDGVATELKTRLLLLKSLYLP